jgi:UDP-glucose 4-epimerase
MGMTKALQERIFIQANMRCPQTRFVCVRYGNVLASRGSVIPLFHDQIRRGGPLTITTPEMTRFLLSLDDAVDTIFAAVREGQPGETWIPKAPSAYVTDIATTLIGRRKINVEFIGIRPGEKVHESLISREEAARAFPRNGYYAIQPMLPELACSLDGNDEWRTLDSEYSSGNDVMTLLQTRELLRARSLMLEDTIEEPAEMLR